MQWKRLEAGTIVFVSLCAFAFFLALSTYTSHLYIISLSSLQLVFSAPLSTEWTQISNLHVVFLTK